MEEKTLPKIIKTRFFLDKEKHYDFDVNQNITIHHVKKIINNATGIKRGFLRLYHDDIEYTTQDEKTLEYLFPGLDLIVFRLDYDFNSPDDYDELVEVKFSNKYCPLHYSKYPYFYCYKCKKSFCSECLKAGLHDGHDWKEKYDYLQTSTRLAKQLFRGLTDSLKNPDDKFILQLKDKIQIHFFPQLIKMVQAIEYKLIDLIDEFIEKEKDITVTKNYMENIKGQCADGLDELKDKICIEDMMLDEEIFLIFDEKFKFIQGEKENILKNIDRYNLFKKQLELIASAVEKVYNDIYAFLDKYLTNDIYEKIRKEIDVVDTVPLNKKDLMIKILANLKKKPIMFIHEHPKGFVKSLNK